MKKITVHLLAIVLVSLFSGCAAPSDPAQVAATTAPVYEFTVRLCRGTNIQVCRLVNENVSCLHDYTLQTSQMQTIEAAEMVIISGAGLEDFLPDILSSASKVVDSSKDISLLCGDDEHTHDAHTHSHAEDPHIWLSPANAKLMVKNICDALCTEFSEHLDVFTANFNSLLTDLSELEQYGNEQLLTLSNRELITFHDGFAYLADAFDLHILHAIEEESGSEASAQELIKIANLIDTHNLNCIFTERNSSTSASQILSAETGADIYALDMAMGDIDYFTAMYHNIDTLKEALK